MTGADRPQWRSRRGRSASAKRSPLPLWAAIGIAVLSGMLMAAQAKVNGELGHRLDNGFAAAAISFGSGLAFLSVAIVLTRSGQQGLRTLAKKVATGGLPFWALLGGCGGALLVLSQSLTGSIIGVATFTIAVIGGQTISGMVLDRMGVGPGGRRGVTPRRIAGALVTVLAVSLSLSVHSGSVPSPWLLLMPFTAGLAIAWQQAVNGRVSVAAGSTLTSTFMNFLVGTIVLGVILAIHTISTPLPTLFPPEPWLYIGGVLGIGFIFGLATAVPVTGVLILGMGTVAGQLSASLALDYLAPEQTAAPDLVTIAATAVVFLSVVMAAPARTPSAKLRDRDAPPRR